MASGGKQLVAAHLFLLSLHNPHILIFFLSFFFVSVQVTRAAAASLPPSPLCVYVCYHFYSSVKGRPDLCYTCVMLVLGEWHTASLPTAAPPSHVPLKSLHRAALAHTFSLSLQPSKWREERGMGTCSSFCAACPLSPRHPAATSLQQAPSSPLVDPLSPSISAQRLKADRHTGGAKRQQEGAYP